jgi:hypothetical protein
LEAWELQRHAEHLTREAEARGLRLEESAAPVPAQLSDLRQALGTGQLRVLVDTTTINNAREALRARHRAPSPFQLLDLSVLTAAVTLFDNVVIQPERHPALEEIHDLTTVLEPSPEVQHQLDTIYGEVWEAFASPQQLQTYRGRWAEFLGLAVSELEVDIDAASIRDAEMVHAYYTRAPVAEAFATAHGVPVHRDRLAMALGINTVRAGFNDAVAGALGVPYIATSIRLPVSSDLTDRKTYLLWVLRQLIATSSPPGIAQPATFASRTPIAAPLLLGLVLERMSKPEDYRVALDEVRDRFAPLRAQLREDQKEAPWDEKPQLYMQRFVKHLTVSDSKFAPAQSAAFDAVKAGVQMTTALDPSFVTAALKVIAAVKPLDLAHRAYLRIWRPEIYVLINLAKDARNLSLLDSRIKRVWGSGLDLEQQRELERFAALRADPFLTPTALT